MRCIHKPPQAENPKGIPPQSPIRATSIGTVNRIEKLRRSAMCIAANAPWSLIKLRRSGMFVRRFMESFKIRDMCIILLDRLRLLPLLPRRRGQGRGGNWDLNPGASLDLGAWDLDLSSATRTK
jgi:hypothetical protein